MLREEAAERERNKGIEAGGGGRGGHPEVRFPEGNAGDACRQQALRWHQGCRLGPQQSRRLCQDYAAQHREALPWKHQDLVGRATEAKSTKQVAPCPVLSWNKTLWTGDQSRAFDQV